MKTKLAFFAIAAALILGLSACQSSGKRIPAASGQSSQPQASSAAALADETIAPSGFTEAVSYRFYTSADQNTREIAYLPMYAEPDASSPCLAQSVSSLFVVARQKDWAYGCWGDKMGWADLSDTAYSTYDTPEDKQYFTLPLPSFLDDSQKVTFLKATRMFNAYIADNEGISLPLIDSDDQYAYDDKGWQAVRDRAFGTYAEFDSTMHDLFTDSYLKDHNSLYREHDGKLYLVVGDRGSWGCAVEGYTLTEQTDSRIAFDVNFIFPQKKGDYRCSLPCVMVKQNGKWLFDDFTSGADDLRWIEAMGPDFNPWEDME